MLHCLLHVSEAQLDGFWLIAIPECWANPNATSVRMGDATTWSDRPAQAREYAVGCLSLWNLSILLTALLAVVEHTYLGPSERALRFDSNRTLVARRCPLRSRQGGPQSSLGCDGPGILHRVTGTSTLSALHYLPMDAPPPRPFSEWDRDGGRRGCIPLSKTPRSGLC